jgi:hypothetical protein
MHGVTKLAIRYQTRDPIPRHHIGHSRVRSPWPVRSGQGRGLLCAHGSCIVRPVELGHKGARSADRAACSSPVGHGSRGWSRARQSAEQPCAHAASASMATAAEPPPLRRRAAGTCCCVCVRAPQSTAVLHKRQSRHWQLRDACYFDSDVVTSKQLAESFPTVPYSPSNALRESPFTSHPLVPCDPP